MARLSRQSMATRVPEAKNRRLASGLSAIRPSMMDQLIFLLLFFLSLITLYPVGEGSRKSDWATVHGEKGSVLEVGY